MLSLDEIVSNIILHGYVFFGYLSIALHYDGRAFLVVIEDAGKRFFDPDEGCGPGYRRYARLTPEGGLGLLLVKNLMDEITYQRAGRNQSPEAGEVAVMTIESWYVRELSDR